MHAEEPLAYGPKVVIRHRFSYQESVNEFVQPVRARKFQIIFVGARLAVKETPDREACGVSNLQPSPFAELLPPARPLRDAGRGGAFALFYKLHTAAILLSIGTGAIVAGVDVT